MACRVKHPLVSVHWLDAYAESSWNDDGKPSRDLTVTFGLLVDRTDEWLTLAMSHGPGAGRGYWGSRWHIPAGMVRKVVVIERKPVCEIKKKPRKVRGL